MNSHSRLGRVFLALAVAAGLYMLLGLLAGYGEIRARLRLFPPALILPLIALSLLNYGLRFLRWQAYLHRLGVPLPRRESLALFFATFAMAITPGKIGEVYKAAYLWERHRVPLAVGLPVLAAERVFDLLGVLALAAVGLATWRGPLGGVGAALLVGLMVPLALAVARSERARLLIVEQAARLPFLRPRAAALGAALQDLRPLTGPAMCAFSLALSVLAWGAECASLWLVCRGLGAPVSAGAAVFVYAAATLAGSLVFLPGGLGGTEGTIVFLLGGLGLSMDVAVTSALVVRLATLWLAVALGLGVFLLARSLFLRPPSGCPPGRSPCPR